MQCTLEEIEVRVVEILTDLISADKGEVKLESKLKEDLSVDNMDRLDFCVDLEEEYYIFLNDIEIGSWVTVKDVVNTINKLTNS